MSNGMFTISRLLNDYVVYIPEIQRDYAQGRENADTEMIRNKLLDDIYRVLRRDDDKCQHVLNYIYGVPRNDGKIELIDGQQRVTTLFLLKWYLAVKSNADLGFLNKLMYATRDSSSEFCDFLEKYGGCIKGNVIPSDAIKNHIKFKKRWLNDPTIANMLNMLDAINERSDKNDNFQKLYDNVDNIKFSFIALDGFKRTEELYAAMNSRGKQLTSFELIKGELLKKKDPELAAIINGEWLPTFWKLSIKYAKEKYAKEKCAKEKCAKEDPEKYASEKHDSFLYNYYSFVVQMIWWSKCKCAAKIKKGDVLPSIMTMTEEILEDSSNMDLLKYVMKLVDTLSEYDFNGALERNNNMLTEKIVLFDGGSDSVQFFELCCLGKEFTQAGRCYLWAYIRYCYDRDQNKIPENRTIRDYYLLMRSLYMRAASNNTPTSIDKLSLNEQLIGNVVIPFDKIIRKDAEYQDWSQSKAFFSDYSRKYEVLNNPFVRGVTDNIGDLKEDGLADNLLWLWKADSLARFKKLAACGFSNLKCEMNGYQARVFLPFAEKMMKSVFSLGGWRESQDFKKLLIYLRNNKLEDQKDKIYDFSDWEYYYIKYDSFREGSYGQFQMPNENQKMSFEAIFIEKERAYKNKIRNPFFYEVYKQKHNGDISYYKFVDDKGIGFRKTEKGFEWEYEGKLYTTDGSKDCIEDFLRRI